MPQKVTFELNGQTEQIIVKEAHLDDKYTRLIGFDPDFCPEYMEKHVMFFSKKLTGIIKNDSPLKVCSVSPTDEKLPEPTVNW